jgi:hypothetical protein
MSKLVLVAGVLWAGTFSVDVAFAEDLTLLNQPAPAWLSATEPMAPPVAPNLVPSPPRPQSGPPSPSAETSRPSKSLHIDVKMDGNGIRVGGRLSGDKGVSAAWLGANVAGNSYGVDGGFQGNGGPPRELKLNLDLLPGWARTAARIWLMMP